MKKGQKENLGKYYFSKAVDFALNGEFGKSYEFIKLGLDLVTCDCSLGGWLNTYRDSDKDLFDDLTINYKPHIEYYFVKAFILSYEQEDKKSLYLALDAIEKYIEKNNDEYGNYLKGRIYSLLEEPQKALEYYEIASSFRESARILYRIGRTKEQHLNEYGLKDLYNSFVLNPTSPCCISEFSCYLRKRGYSFSVKKDDTNELFNHFQTGAIYFVYDNMLKNQLKESSLETGEYTVKICVFIKEISEYFNFLDEMDELIDEEYGDEGYYEEPNWQQEYDFIEDALDGMPDAYWNID